MPDANKVFLAIDLGASGGRVVAGLFATVGVADFLQIAYRLGQQRLED